jgi:hypothetical protein
VNSKTDAEIGQKVYLKPTTKTAPRECYSGLAAELVSTDAWPYVYVTIDSLNSNGSNTLRVHRLNVVLHPPGFTAKKSNDGDGQNSTETERKIKPAFRPHKPLDLPDGVEEPTLF